MIPSLYLIQIC